MLWYSFLVFIVLLIKEISSQDAIPRTTYTTADLELECEIEPGAVVVGWSKVLDGGIRTEIFVLTVSSGEITDQRQDNEYMNFGHTPDPTSFYNLIISNVTKDDGGTYECDNTPGVLLQFQVDAEVPGNVKIKNGSKDVESLTVTVGEVYDITCSATGTRSKNDLYFVWEPDLDSGTPDSRPNGEDGNLTDYTITSTYTPRKDDTSIRCQLMGYALQDEIKDLVFDSISLIVNYKPDCSLMLNTANDDCRMVILTCQCTALPTEIKEYLFFNGSSLINSTVVNTLNVNGDFDSSSEFSCQASNDVGRGENSNQVNHSCEEGTTAKPTTTVTTEITSATPVPTATGTSTMTTMFTTTAPPKPTTQGSSSTPDPDGLHIAVIIVIVLVCLALIVIVVIVVVKCVVGGHSTDSHKPGSPGNEGGIVTPLSVSTTSSSAPLYGEVKKDKKKKSDETSIDLENKETSQPEYAVPNKKKSNKPDGNGAGPENDLPTYAAVDKPQPTAAPRTSEKGPEPDGMELQYADLDHTGKPATSEIRKPQDEPTEYATVQSVIV